MADDKKKIWIEVFRAGKQTDSAGNSKDWTEADLDIIVDKYNNQEGEDKHEAPVVLGHPQTDSPAYGWVESLKREGNLLFAQLKDLKDDFVQWVKDGHYKKRSISLYNDMNLKHVGFLGGTPPAIKGLTDPAFKENQEEGMLFEFADNQQLADLLARVEKYGIGVKEADTGMTKPSAYKDLSDDSFADPVNYLYPIHDLPNLLSTIRNYDRWDNCYSAIERQVIHARIYSAAQALGLDLLTDERLRYFKGNKKNNIINYSQGVANMQSNDSKHIADEFVKLVANFCKTTYGDEVAEGVLTVMEKNKTIIKGAPATTEEPTPQFSEFANSKEYKEMQKKIEQVERTNHELQERNLKIATEAYFNEQKAIGQLVPAQRPIVELAFEVARKGQTVTYNFSDKTVDGETVIKQLIASFDKKVEFNEFAHDGASQRAAQYAEEDKYIEEFNKSRGF